MAVPLACGGLPIIATPTARREARISIDLHAMLKRTAEWQGRTVTDFIVSTVHQATGKTRQQSDVATTSVQDQECSAQALLSPPKPTGNDEPTTKAEKLP